MFKGHQFVKLINDNWILDLTEFKGYEVNLDKNGEILSVRHSFSLIVNEGNINLEKEKGLIPVKIIREAIKQASVHLDLMGLDKVE